MDDAITAPLPCETLRHGVMLRTIVEAVARIGSPTAFHGTVTWRRANLFEISHDGPTGLIAFAGGLFVGLFYDNESSRNPFRQDNQPLRVDKVWPFFTGMPEEIQSLITNSMLMRFDVNAGVPTAERILWDGPLPIITAAFWCIGRYVEAGEPWPSVLRHGGRLLRELFIDDEQEFSTWAVGMEPRMTNDEIALVWNWRQRKVACGGRLLILDEADRARLDSVTGPKYHEAWHQWQAIRERLWPLPRQASQRKIPRSRQVTVARRMLAHVGIILP